MIEGKKVLAITLARGGSKRVPRKNIIKINNIPLLEYTTREVKKSKYIDHYVVSTEDKEIIKVCNELQVAHHVRPDILAQDTTTSAAAIRDVINSNHNYDIIVEVMCTNPLKNVIDIDACIEKLVKTNSDSVVSVVQLWDHHPSRIKYIQNDVLKDFYPEIPETRRQDLTPSAYIRNGSIYAFCKNSFICYNNRLGSICRPYVMPEERSINIDEPNDLEMANIILTKNNNIKTNNSNENMIEYCSRLDSY